MYTYKATKQPRNTHEMVVNVPVADIEKEYETAFVALHSDLAIEGFRKGKVPKELAIKHIAKEDVYNGLMRAMLPRIYEEIIKKEGYKPIVSPKIELIKAKEKEDWQFKITLAERPSIDLGKYKEVVKKAKEEAQKADIWTPGKSKDAPSEQDKTKQNQQILNMVLEGLLKEAKVEIPDMIIEDDVNHKLTQTVDDIQKIGLTTDAYLKSKNLTMDDLKARLHRETEDTYKLEFILMEIADKEHITVEQADLDKLMGTITDEKEKKAAAQNAYFYATILRKQRVLEFLTSL